jgi:hypothetical protein
VFCFSIIYFSKYVFEYPNLISVWNAKRIDEYRMLIGKLKFSHFLYPPPGIRMPKNFFPFRKKLVSSFNEMSHADSGYIKIFVKNVHYCGNLVNIWALFIKNECIYQGTTRKTNWTVSKQLIRCSFTRWIWIWYYFSVLVMKCVNKYRNFVKISVKYHEKNVFFVFLPYFIDNCYSHKKLIIQLDRAEAPLSSCIYDLLRQFDFC